MRRPDAASTTSAPAHCFVPLVLIGPILSTYLSYLHQQKYKILFSTIYDYPYFFLLFLTTPTIPTISDYSEFPYYFLQLFLTFLTIVKKYTVELLWHSCRHRCHCWVRLGYCRCPRLELEQLSGSPSSSQETGLVRKGYGKEEEKNET